MSSEWTPHSDGYVMGDVGVFPYLFGSWEVWHRVSGEWSRNDSYMPFKTIEEAKIVALSSHSDAKKEKPEAEGN